MNGVVCQTRIASGPEGEYSGIVDTGEDIKYKLVSVKLKAPSTSYNNPDLSRLSDHLTHALGSIGFSEEKRTSKISACVMGLMLDETSTAILPNCVAKYCQVRMGSSIEGTTAVRMFSDIDTLVLSPKVKAHCNKENTKHSLGLVLTRDESTPAGYTKLQPACQGCVINDASDGRLCMGTIMLLAKFETDSKGRLVLAHFTELSTSTESILTFKKHGPAETTTNPYTRCDEDYVRAVLCDDITNEMEEWCMRDRIHDWPSKDTRELFKTLGCCVVAVGHPSSPENNLEWRMSFSLQERHLMWHLNPTQYHCFMLLKFVKVFLIKPQFGDVLTSYHCKTLMFYTIEENEQGIWIPENLISCLRKCLILLHAWISDKCIPNYFVPKENMFIKMDAALKGNYDKLKSCVAEMGNNWKFLSRIGYKDLWKQFLANIHGVKLAGECRVEGVTTTTEYIDSDLKRQLSSSCDVYINEIKNVLDYLDVILAIIQSPRTCSRYTTFEENIHELYNEWFDRCTKTIDTPQRVLQLTESFAFRLDDREIIPRTFAVKVWKSNVQMMLGSVLAAMHFQTGHEQYLLESDTYLELGKTLRPMCSMLIKATVLLKQSLFDSSDVVLNAAEIISKDTVFMCRCYDSPFYDHYVMEMRKETHQKRDCVVVFSALFCSSCLYFKHCELDILPSPLTFESYRSYGTPTISLQQKQSSWVDMVVVDPVMYLYYLQFLNNHHNDPGEADVALQKLENTLFGRLGRSDWPGHTDTWLNMLGDIFVKKGWTALALKCFKESYKLWPLHNAVRWHVIFLLLKFSESECNIPIIPDCRPCCCPHSCIVENVD